VQELQYDLERDAVRVVLTDTGGRVLLFHVLTPDEAPDGWWELPGGGIDPGETYLGRGGKGDQGGDRPGPRPRPG
jgi:8-oxo-dGTP pyrophosphatase MutT (NUDIX family)